MSVNYDSKYSSDLAAAPLSETESDDWGPHASWPETIATLLVTGVALLFVSFLAVVMGLA
jgi:hypothetical protein